MPAPKQLFEDNAHARLIYRYQTAFGWSDYKLLWITYLDGLVLGIIIVAIITYACGGSWSAVKQRQCDDACC